MGQERFATPPPWRAGQIGDNALEQHDESGAGVAQRRRVQSDPEGRAEDRYGRSLLVASRGGVNVAEVLLAEGLAERRGGRENV